MRKDGQYGSKLAAALLTSTFLALVFCPPGMVALEIRGHHAPSRLIPYGGCHGSLPQTPQAPAAPHKCCMPAPAAKPSLTVARYAWMNFVAVRLPNREIPIVSGTASQLAPQFSPMPRKLSVLRI